MRSSIPVYVREIMSRNVAVLREEENLFAAERGMKGLNFRHVPVVDAGRFVGLVSERDFTLRLLRNDHSRFEAMRRALG